MKICLVSQMIYLSPKLTPFLNYYWISMTFSPLPNVNYIWNDPWLTPSSGQKVNYNFYYISESLGTQKQIFKTFEMLWIEQDNFAVFLSDQLFFESLIFYFHRLTQIPVFVYPLRYLQISPGRQSASLLHLWQPPMKVLHGAHGTVTSYSSGSILELRLLLLSSSGLSQTLQYQMFGRIDEHLK